MRSFAFSLAIISLPTVIFGQSDRGTITAQSQYPAGAVVPNAAIEAKNTQTGVAYSGATSATGNYTLLQLPSGPYELSVNRSRF